VTSPSGWQKEKFMRFSILLALLVFKFRKAARNNKNFQVFLMGHECAVVIRTKDGKRGKRFIFKNGLFAADPVLDHYDVAMVWSDATTAFNGLKNGEEGIKQALRNHFVYLDGKIQDFSWFGAVLKFCMT
jgi:hypothetical protein